MKTTNNPNQYRVMCEPYPTREAAQAALDLFYEGLSELRVKHRISDLQVISEVHALTDEGEDVELTSRSHFGSGANELRMIARAYGDAKRRNDELFALLISGKR